MKSGEFCCSLECAVVSILSEAIYIAICLSPWSCPILQAINIKKALGCGLVVKSRVYCFSLDCAVVSILNAVIHLKFYLFLWSRPILQAINLNKL